MTLRATRFAVGSNRSVIATALVAVVFFLGSGAFAQEQNPYESGPDSGYGQAPVDGNVVVEPAEGVVEQGSAEPAEQPGPSEQEQQAESTDQGESAESDESADQGENVDQEETADQDEQDQAEREAEEKSLIEKEARKLKPFGGAHMIYGRNVKLPTASRRFAVGVDLAVAPLNVVGKVAKDKFTDMAFDKICGSATDQTQCRAAIEGAVEVLSSVSDSEWQTIRSAAGGDKTALLDALEAVGVSDAALRDSIAEVVYDYADDVVDPEQRMQAVDAVRAGSTSSAVNMLFNPYFHMNFKWIEATVSAPFAIRTGDDGTQVDMANIGVDLKSGGDWTFGKVASIAVAGGLELFMPSGTSGISDSLGSDVFSTPKYTYGMLTWAPYLVFGVEFARVIQLQAHLELVSMHGVLDGAESDHVMYLKYGGGFILLPRFLLSIMVELNGCTGLKNSSWDDVLLVGAGLNFSMKFFKIFLGIQVPLLDQGKYVWDAGYWTGANYDQLSKFNVMTRIGFEF